MIIGIDFDNTIVCYDGVFHKVALERGLIPAELPVTKGAVRDYLRGADQEDVWTEMQGYVYGARMNDVESYPGASDFFRRCAGEGHKALIISHKTEHPYMGERYDLHRAAYDWLGSNGFFDSAIGLDSSDVHFNLKKEDKLECIAQCNCDWFVDDLPEFLEESDFPALVKQVLFDPSGAHSESGKWTRAGTWREVESIVLSA